MAGAPIEQKVDAVCLGMKVSRATAKLLLGIRTRVTKRRGKRLTKREEAKLVERQGPRQAPSRGKLRRK